MQLSRCKNRRQLLKLIKREKAKEIDYQKPNNRNQFLRFDLHSLTNLIVLSSTNLTLVIVLMYFAQIFKNRNQKVNAGKTALCSRGQPQRARSGDANCTVVNVRIRVCTRVSVCMCVCARALLIKFHACKCNCNIWFAAATSTHARLPSTVVSATGNGI